MLQNKGLNLNECPFIGEQAVNTLNFNFKSL